MFQEGRYCGRMFHKREINQVIFHFWDILRDYVPLLGHWQQRLRSVGAYNFHFWDITDYTHSLQGIQTFCIPHVGGMELLCPICGIYSSVVFLEWEIRCYAVAVGAPRGTEVGARFSFPIPSICGT